MKACGYSAMDKHIQEHQEIENAIKDLAARWRGAASEEVRGELVALMKRWMIDHILGEDLSLSPLAEQYSKEISDALRDLDA